MHHYLILPFVAAFMFASASLCFKRAFSEGASLSIAFLLNNSLLGLVFLPCLLLPRSNLPWHLAYQPIVTGSVFFLALGPRFSSLLASAAIEPSMASRLSTHRHRVRV